MRTQQIKQMLSEGVFAVEPKYLQSVIDTVNSGELEARKETDNSFSTAHSYEVLGNTAVISIDGATTKKNTWMNAMCGGFIGYDTIANYILQAENDNSVENILLHIDTPGGEVAGVDTLQELIADSPKHTVTLFENVGASAGIWYGTASDKVYATPMTQVGSIGVMAGYFDPKNKDDQKKVLVSRNATNKNCTLNGDCANKIQARIDAVEDVFHERVSRNTGLSVEELITHFDYGDVVSAQEAANIGFLDGVISKKELLVNLAQNTSHDALDKSKDNIEGGNMPKEQLEALQSEFDEATATIATMTSEMSIKDETISALNEKVESLTAELGASSSKEAVMTKALNIGFEMGASKEVITEAMKAESEMSAENIILRDSATNKATHIGEEKIEEDNDEKAKQESDALMAFAAKNKIKG